MLLLFSVLSLGLTAYGRVDPQADLTVHIILWVRLGCFFVKWNVGGDQRSVCFEATPLWSFRWRESGGNELQRTEWWKSESHLVRKREGEKEEEYLRSIQGVTSGWDCSPSWPRVLSSFSTWEDREWVDGLAIENVLWEVEIDSPFLPDKCPIWLRITTRGAYIPRATYGLSCCMWKYCKVATNRKTPQRNCDFFFFSGLGSKITHKEDKHFSVMADLYCTHCQCY